MSSPRTEVFRRAARWLLPATALALAPKCVLCLLAYAGIGAALGFGGPEICGAANTGAGHGLVWFALAGAVLGLVFVFTRRRAASGSTPSNRGRDA